MTATVPERRTAMYYAQLGMGASMADTDGWKLPLHYRDPEQESTWLRETVGASDVSPLGKVRVVGEDAARAVAELFPGAMDQSIGAVLETDSTLERGGKLLSARLARDEFLVLTPAGVGALAADSMPPTGSGCSHAVDVTSGLSAVAIVGPATLALMSRITEMDTSPRALTNLTCVQSRFADVQGLLLRRDVRGIPMYQLYVGREFGEYIWETLIETARDVGGGPVGTQALVRLRDPD